MKKNVKYIGSAVAVALLAAGAPVVVPMLMPVTIVEAGNNYNPPADPYTYFTAFKNQWADQYVSNNKAIVAVLKGKIGWLGNGNPGSGFSYFDPDHPDYFKDFQDDTDVAKLKSFSDPYATEDTNSNYYYRDVLGSITVYDANGKQILLRNNADYNAAIDNFNEDKIDYPLTLRVRLVTNEDDKDYNPHTLDDPKIVADKSLTDFSFTVSKSEFDVTSDPAVSVVGTSVANINSGNNSLSIVDKYTTDEGASKTRTPIYGQSLFSSEKAAIAYSEKSDFSPATTNGGDVSDAVSSGKVAKAGVYYQTVSYKVDNGDDAAITAMINKTKDDNTQKPVDPYDTRINSVKKVEGTNYSFNYSTKMLTIARPVTVTDNATPVLNPINVTVNSSSKSDKLTDTTDEYLQDNLGNKLNTTGVSFDSDYYTNSSATDKVTGLIDANGNFTKSGVYYRKVTFTLPDGDVGNLNFSPEPTEKGTNTVTFTQEIDVQDAANTKIASATANIGDKTSVSTATDGNDITDKDGTSLLVKSDSHPDGVSFGTDYYEVSPTDANKQAILNDPTKVGQSTADVVTDGAFNKAGTYLRTITFYLTWQEIANNTFNGVDPNVKVSTEYSTVTYVQTITINPHDVTPTIRDVHTAIGTSVTASGLHDPSTVTLPSGDDSLLDKTKGDNDSGISFGNIYYDDSTLQNQTKNISATNRLNTAKTYHRLVTFYLTDTTYDQSNFNGSYSHSDEDKTVSYMQDVIVDPSTKTATFGNHDLEVPYNTATSSSTLTGTSDYTLADDDGSTGSIKDSASLDGKYYASEADAKAGTNALTVDKLTDSTYYRVITIKVKSGDGYTYSYPGADKVDAENDEVQYIQKISVDKDIATINVPSESIVSGNILRNINSGTNIITNGSGSTISTGTVGTTYYDNPADALNDGSATSSRIVTDGTAKRVTGPAGTMYRTVTFTLNSGTGSNYTFKGADGDVEGINYKIDGDTVTYAQPINITVDKVTTVSIAPKTVDAGSNPADIKNDAKDINVKNSTGIVTNSLIDTTGTIKYGTTYYDKDTKAVDNDVLDADGNFSKSGSFYREVTIPLKNNYASSYDFNVNDQYVSVDTEHDTVTYLQEVDVNAEQGKGDAPDKHTYTGVPIKDLNTKSDYTLMDGKNNNLSSGVSFGNKYYPTAQDAVAGTNEITNADTNGDFDDAGDYYREVTFTLTPEAAGKYAFTDEFNGEKPIVTKTDDVTTVTYIQHIHVDKNVATATIAHEKVAADSNIADVPQPDPTLNTLLDKNIQADAPEGHTVVTNDGKDVTADNSQYYDSTENYDPNNTSKYVVNGKFTKAGTYYRRITFALIPGVSAADDFNGNDVVLVDKTDNSVTYLQAVDVTLNTAVANVVGTSATVGQSVSDIDNANETSDINNGVDKIVRSISYGDSYYQNSTDFMKGVAPIGKTFAAAGDFYRVITFKLNANALDGNTLDDTIHTTTTNSDGTVSVSYAQKVKVAPATVDAKVVDPFEVVAGSNVSDDKENNDITLNGTSVVKSVKFGDYYDVTQSIKDILADPTNATKVTGVTDSEGNYVKAGTYYRTVIFTLNDGTAGNITLPDTPQHSVVGNTVTYVQKFTVDPIKVNSNVAGPTVASGSSTTADTVTSADGIHLVDGNNKSLDIPTPVVGTTYYTSKDGALANDGKTDVATDATETSANGTVFDNVGPYYRTITFTPAAGTIGEYTSADPKTVRINGNGTITYAQAINVVAGKATVTIDTPKATVGQSVNDATLKDNSDITVNGKSIVVPGSITYGDNYYRRDVDCLGDNKALGTTFDKADNENGFYRRITFTLEPNVLDNVDLSNKEYQVVRNSDGTATVTYVQNVMVDPATAEVSVADPIEVTAGSSASDEQNSENEKSNNKITSNGATVKSVSFGNYYDSSLDPSDIVSGKATATDGVVNNDKFVKAGTFYRTVIFELDGNATNISLPDTTPHYVDGNTVTYVQKVTIDPIMVSVTDTTSPSFASGSSTSDPSVTSTTGISLNDGKIADPVIGTTYYTSENGALDNDGKTYVATDATTADGKNFSTAGTYFRTVTFTPAAGTIGEYASNNSNVKVNGNGTITYAQAITVGKNGAADSSSIADLAVKVNVSGDNDVLTSPERYTLKDKDGNNLIDTTQPNSGVSFSSDYIDTKTGKTADADVASGAKITKAGTYTRQITFNLTDDGVKNNDFSKLKGFVSFDPSAKTVTFTQTVTASTNPAKLDVKNPSVSSGTNANDLNNPKDVSVTDEKGNPINSGDPTFGGIFKTPEAAKADNPAGGDVTGNLPAGTYYQKVTVPLKENASNAYDFGPNATVDTTNNTVSYIRTITVNPSTGGGGSNADDEWTYFKNPGVVTTKTDQDYYYMNHKDNSTVANRTLSKDSSWLTDQYRTNRAGVKQYRVATDEWVDSRYVYFLDKATDNNNTDDEWTYYKAPGIVTTKTDQNYYYMNHKDDSTVANRTLGKDSSWITDQYRTNREGVKQYRVATDEWVDSNSVIFTQNVITDISPIKGIVNLDSTNAYYTLYTKEGDVVGNRALKEKSSWLVDEIGRDAQGNVYYRVATNEWVKVVPGVYFDNKAWY